MKTHDFLFLFVLAFTFIQCDETTRSEITPLRDYEEQRTADDESIISFLQSHYYNYEDYANAASGERVEFTIDSLVNSPDKRPMIDDVVEHQVHVKDQDGNFIAHTMYVIPNVRGGVGDSPTIADEVYITYKGLFLDGFSFDQSEQQIWFTGLSTIQGFYELYPFIKRGTWEVDPATGLVSYDGFGTAVVIMPSALGYYGSQSSPNGRKYAPLIFAIDLYTFATADHDQDSVPTSEEDTDGNRHFTDDVDDTDGNGIPNYLDNDDDGDGILTIDEYDVDADGVADDSDGDGTPDYLDAS
jgi:FKBP-type peptidyl-prolyl cis-trans isomerase FkpA